MWHGDQSLKQIFLTLIFPSYFVENVEDSTYLNIVGVFVCQKHYTVELVFTAIILCIISITFFNYSKLRLLPVTKY